MIDRFEIIGHSSPRPDAEHIIFCDGAGGDNVGLEREVLGAVVVHLGGQA